MLPETSPPLRKSSPYMASSISSSSATSAGTSFLTTPATAMPPERGVGRSCLRRHPSVAQLHERNGCRFKANQKE